MKKGFTLIELLVYISLLGVIIVIAGRVFSDSTKFRIRTQNMLKATEDAAKAGDLIKEDLLTMGAKSWKTGATTTDSFQIESMVYVDPNNAIDTLKDSSSFILYRSNTGKDTIVFRRVSYNANGTFFAIHEINWGWGEGNKLWRSCKTIKGTATSACPNNGQAVLMAENVTTFSLTPGRPGDGPDTLFPASGSSGFRLSNRVAANFSPVTLDPENPGDASITISGFSSNYNEATGAPNLSGKDAHEIYVLPKSSNSGNWSSLCKEFTFLPKTPYLIKMNIPYLKNDIRMFHPGLDHMAIGLRKKDGSALAGVSDYALYPSFSDSSKTERNVEMVFAEDTIKACLAFTFAFYSPIAHEGSIQINDFMVLLLNNRTYQFDEGYSGNITSVRQKKDVKAFKLNLTVTKQGESGEAEGIIPVLNNGEKANPTPAS